jgi:hypothetical protein
MVKHHQGDNDCSEIIHPVHALGCIGFIDLGIHDFFLFVGFDY